MKKKKKSYRKMKLNDINSENDGKKRTRTLIQRKIDLKFTIQHCTHTHTLYNIIIIESKGKLLKMNTKKNEKK